MEKVLFGSDMHRHPYFDDNPMADVWQQLGAGWAEDMYPILDFAQQNRESLPGAAYFHMPPYAHEHPDWAALLKETEPYCACLSRRIMWPGRGRSRLLSGAQTATLVHGSGVSYALVPRGAELDMAFALIKFAADRLRVEQRPFMQDKRIDERLIKCQAGMGNDPVYPFSWETSVFNVGDSVLRFGELAFMQLMPGPGGPPAARVDYPGWIPLCSVTSLVRQESDVTITLEFDPSITVVGLDDYRDVEKHVCNPDERN